MLDGCDWGGKMVDVCDGGGILQGWGRVVVLMLVWSGVCSGMLLLVVALLLLLMLLMVLMLLMLLGRKEIGLEVVVNGTIC